MPVFVSFDQGFQGAVDQVAGFVPRLVAAMLIVAVGWLLARAVRRFTERVVVSAGGDRALADGLAAVLRERAWPGVVPSRAAGRAAGWLVLALAVFAAIGVLDVRALSDAAASVAGYIPNVLAAVLILAAAAAVAVAVARGARRLMAGTLLGRIVETAVPALVVTIAVFMALVQLRIAQEIVVATYVLVLGALALGFALAFGLGGRDVAGRILLSAYAAGQERGPQLRRELRHARTRADEERSALRAAADARRERLAAAAAEAEAAAAAAAVEANGGGSRSIATGGATAVGADEADDDVTDRTPTVPGNLVGSHRL